MLPLLLATISEHFPSPMTPEISSPLIEPATDSGISLRILPNDVRASTLNPAPSGR